MAMKRLVPLFCVLLVGCVPIEGTLKISQPLTLSVREYEVSMTHPCARRDDDCERRVRTESTQQFLPGTYSAKLRIDLKESITLSFAESSRTKTVIDLKLPENTHIPDRQGRFLLAARDVGQLYDVAGSIDTDRQRSETYSTWESCSYLVRRLSCYANQCEHVYVSIYGHRPVEYHHEYETKTVVLDLLAVGSKQNLARFDGAATRASKIYDYAGFCH